MNLTKDDILTFFSKEYGKEECDQTCPFVEECNSILAKTSGRDTLCGVFGVCSATHFAAFSVPDTPSGIYFIFTIEKYISTYFK